MRPDAKLDARVAAFLARHGGTTRPRSITRLCSDLIDVAEATVPVNLEMLASFRNARVTVLDQEQAETIMWDGKHFVIRVRQADTEGRQRFSCAHGIIHTYLHGGRQRPAGGGAAHDSWSPQEEDLCDQGAAELLLPRAAFIAACPSHPDMDDVLRLAEAFDASAEATALRIVTLSATPAAMIVLEPTLKPAELSAHRTPPVGARRCPAFGWHDPVTPRLRVQKSLGHHAPRSYPGTNPSATQHRSPACWPMAPPITSARQASCPAASVYRPACCRYGETASSSTALSRSSSMPTRGSSHGACASPGERGIQLRCRCDAGGAIEITTHYQDHGK